MKVLICTSIYPPDIGGPATHARDLQHELASRGHSVHVLSLGDQATVGPQAGCTVLRRSRPWPLRSAAVALWMLRNRHAYDVVYATGLQGIAVLAGSLSRRPVVAKVVGDPAWERGRRLGSVSRDFDQFQVTPDPSLRVHLMRCFRNWWARKANAITVPSAYLRGVVLGWGVPSSRVTVVPNAVRVSSEASPSGPQRPGLRLIFVGRLVSHKRVDIILRAIDETPKVHLEVIGDGPERVNLVNLTKRLGLTDQVDFLGRMPHDDVLARIASSDALLLASEYEGLPHVAVEALATGTPVLAPKVGGVTELVTDGHNGLLYEPVATEPVRDAILRLLENAALRHELSHRAASSVGEGQLNRSVALIESQLCTAASRR